MYSFMKWVSFQPMLRRIYGCSFLPHHDYGKRGRGWRDLWQDCLSLLVMNPRGADWNDALDMADEQVKEIVKTKNVWICLWPKGKWFSLFSYGYYVCLCFI